MYQDVFPNKDPSIFLWTFGGRLDEYKSDKRYKVFEPQISVYKMSNTRLLHANGS